jgi:hypothetical protein
MAMILCMRLVLGVAVVSSGSSARATPDYFFCLQYLTAVASVGKHGDTSMAQRQALHPGARYHPATLSNHRDLLARWTLQDAHR